MHRAVHTWLVVAVKDAESEEGSIAMSCKWCFCQSCQVIHVIEGRTVMIVVTSQQQVNMVRSL